jgi:drug/metabolite transporter (DMT)-like permease
MQESNVRDYAHLHFLVLIWGFTAILGVLISIPTVEVVLIRTLLSLIGLGAVMVLTGKKIIIDKKEALKIILTGFLIAAHWIFFFASARVSTVSVCLAGLATTSFWTSLLEPVFMKRNFRWYEIFLGIVVLSGLYIVLRFEFDHALGLFLGILAALTSALFTVINGRLIRNHNHYTITFYEMGGAFLGTCLFLPIYISFFSNGTINLAVNASDWIYLIILAWICTVYAYSAAVELMKRLSAYSISITVNLEPVYGIVLAVLFFGEREKMNFEFYLGTMVILLSVLSYPLISKYYRKKALRVESIR